MLGSIIKIIRKSLVIVRCLILVSTNIVINGSNRAIKYMLILSAAPDDSPRDTKTLTVDK